MIHVPESMKKMRETKKMNKEFPSQILAPEVIKHCSKEKIDDPRGLYMRPKSSSRLPHEQHPEKPQKLKPQTSSTTNVQLNTIQNQKNPKPKNLALQGTSSIINPHRQEERTKITQHSERIAAGIIQRSQVQHTSTLKNSSIKASWSSRKGIWGNVTLKFNPERGTLWREGWHERWAYWVAQGDAPTQQTP